MPEFQEPADQPVKRTAGQPGRQPAKQDRATIGLLLVAAFVAVGGIGFAIGHVTAQGGTAAATNAAGLGGGRGGLGRAGGFPSLAPGQSFNTNQFGGGRNAVGGVSGGITGTVQSVTATSITIQEASGTSVTIDLSGNTTYHSAAAASPSDVKVGTSVTVQIDTAALASQSPNPSASGGLGGRTLTAKDVLITTP
jgi:3D (Asp-Asp-Asp) domain-containing protein